LAADVFGMSQLDEEDDNRTGQMVQTTRQIITVLAGHLVAAESAINESIQYSFFYPAGVAVIS
jgi:hypothetical protein